MLSKPRLFFVGVGNMGNPMAANLIKAGYPTTVFDASHDKAENLLAQGAHWADSLALGAENADVVMCSLPGPKQVREVMMGDQGLIAHVNAGATIIDTSTSAVDLVKELLGSACHQCSGLRSPWQIVYFCRWQASVF